MLAFRPMMPIWVKKTAAKILLKERKAIISKMKSLTAVCQTGASMPAINPNGRINRHPPHRGDGENAEMKMYLSKLKDLVPFMPKNHSFSLINYLLVFDQNTYFANRLLKVGLDKSNNGRRRTLTMHQAGEADLSRARGHFENSQCITEQGMPFSFERVRIIEKEEQKDAAASVLQLHR
ncbi:hypothetical protein GQX74_004477 [Glossina fuscipes]|nr:hypothetical protein GQX74_004477 [Glossina fuscipes]